MMKNIFEQALAINTPWYIKSINFEEDNKQLDIYIDLKKGHKFYYEDKENNINGNFPVYDTVKKTCRHLFFFQHECRLHCRTPRVKISNGKVRLISPPWFGVNSKFTMLFESLIIELCKNMSVNAVSKMINEDDKKLWRILEKYN